MKFFTLALRFLAAFVWCVLIYVIISLSVLLVGCDDPDLIVLEELLQEDPGYLSPYTGELHRVGTVEKFNVGAKEAIALEWNGESLYMLAYQGRYQDKSQYLFEVDKDTGVATVVNHGAPDLGGSFKQGRGFTQVLYVRPSDLAWDASAGRMLAVCAVLDTIVSIDLDRGLAGRISWQEDYCLFNDDGYAVIGGGQALVLDTSRHVYVGCQWTEHPDDPCDWQANFRSVV